jgi:hypothetical protein
VGWCDKTENQAHSFFRIDNPSRRRQNQCDRITCTSPSIVKRRNTVTPRSLNIIDAFAEGMQQRDYWLFQLLFLADVGESAFQFCRKVCGPRDSMHRLAGLLSKPQIEFVRRCL